MEGLFAAAAQFSTGFAILSQNAKVYRDEVFKLARYVAKLSFILSELELLTSESQSHRGDHALFLALDASVQALKTSTELVSQFCQRKQHAATGVWPLEDASEFQSVAGELYNAITKFQDIQDLPADVVQDIDHVERQLKNLSFTIAELEETDEEQIAEFKHERKGLLPRQEEGTQGVKESENGKDGASNTNTKNASGLPQDPFAMTD